MAKKHLTEFSHSKAEPSEETKGEAPSFTQAVAKEKRVSAGGS
jgi:hypothetical protein